MICRKATFTVRVFAVMLPDANFLSSRAQNQGFCALLAFGTPVFRLFEHKNSIFVLGEVYSGGVLGMVYSGILPGECCSCSGRAARGVARSICLLR